MQKRWFVRTSNNGTAVEELRSTLKIDSIVAELLLQRDIDTFKDAEAFFRPKLEQLHNPFLMKDMERAVSRVKNAIANNEKVMLYGDYDVDGTTSVALMYTLLKNHVEDLSFYIPDRYEEGYGVSMKGVQHAIEEGITLIITLDCGIKALKQVEAAKKEGVDVIVCDHHRPGDSLPNGIILDPKREDCDYPFQELSGCGVGFKLMQALYIENKWLLDPLWNNLDLLAISIGADLVEMTGENRTLCSLGMKLLNESPRTAFKEMLILAKRTFPVTLTDVVFTIAPRINAAGRLRSGKHAVELMISDNIEEIRIIAAEINDDNTERRSIDKEITVEALEMLKEYPEDRCSNVVFSPNWHKGVVGIVASRIIENHYKPTIVLTESKGVVTGSARSVQGFDVHEAIEKCGELIEQFGGHKYAAGLTLKTENLEAFKQKFEEEVSKSIDRELLIPEQKVDLELDFNQIFTPEENRLKVPRLKRVLRQFEPHGPENMKPVFITKNVYSTDVRLLKDAHLKLSMTQPQHDVIVEAIGFNMADKVDDVSSGMPFDILYTLEINRWRDRETLQLNIKDIRSSV